MESPREALAARERRGRGASVHVGPPAPNTLNQRRKTSRERNHNPRLRRERRRLLRQPSFSASRRQCAAGTDSRGRALSPKASARSATWAPASRRRFVPLTGQVRVRAGCFMGRRNKLVKAGESFGDLLKAFARFRDSLKDVNMPNLPLQTRGGKICWRDVACANGWRLQKNRLVGTYRILDPGNVRRAWGGVRAMKKFLEGSSAPCRD